MPRILNHMTDHKQFDYSKTLNLPAPDLKTEDGLDTNINGIPLKANLPQREPKISAFWDAIDVYSKSLVPLSSNGTFILHDGPPYSNNNIHLGTAMNKVLKDMINKCHSMQGFRTPYVPGWDNHGLPIETAVTKEYREKKIIPTQLELRKRCREYAAGWVNVQREQFRRLGVRADWDHPYLTMSNGFEASIIETFRQLVAAGFVYRGVKPVHWCVTDQTALADAEIEYSDRTDTSIFVRFPLKADPSNVFGNNAVSSDYVIIWTTTPWTIPANAAVAVHPHFTYCIVEYNGDKYLLAEGRVEAVMAQIGAEDYTIVKRVQGLDLADMLFKHPLFERDSPVVFADYVTLDEGTGVVHTAPGHGREDFITGQKNGLPIISPVDAAGRFTAEAGDTFAGQTIWQGNDSVVEALREAGALLALEKINHSYPHCWRCHNPVIFRATAQWFMNIDHNGHRQRCLDEIDKVTWFPAESINRIKAMVAGRPDWCLSRQRTWGVGIPVFYCQTCEAEVLDTDVIAHVRDLVAEFSSDVWFERSAAELLPKGYHCKKCGESSFAKESDIFDVWFDSGATNRAVLDSGYWSSLSWPADVYIEGGDQHRGWFNSSLMLAVATKGHAPFKQVITHGWTLDEHGKAMHKSTGNAIPPSKITDKFGADVLRLWVASTDYFSDVRLGDKILDQVAGTYRQLRNTLRFSLGNLYDFDVEDNAVAYADLYEIDQYALQRLGALVKEAVDAYSVHEFHRVTQAAKQFCAVDMSSFYLDVIKDRLYADAPGSRSRRAAQTVLFEVTSSLSRLLSPILSFTCEEVWQSFRMPDKPESVELTSLPVPRDQDENSAFAEKWSKLLAVRDEVNKTIEEHRQQKVIGKPLEAQVDLSVDSQTFDFLTPYKDQLATIFLVSDVSLHYHNGERSITVSRAEGVKCARCWLIKKDVSDSTMLCGRCSAVVNSGPA
jgi:isoleucyl-tRNA synthetase